MERAVRLEPGTTKDEEARLIPLSKELYEVLAMQMAIRDEKYPDCPWVFFREGKPIGEFDKSWASACKRAGLWDKESDKPTKLFHHPRRTGAQRQPIHLRTKRRLLAGVGEDAAQPGAVVERALKTGL